MTDTDTDVAIIGGGIAGLTCARVLHENNVDFLLVEADNRIGGRIKTDPQDGFLLDRGFQVLQTGYPAAREELDYTDLQLQTFAPGTIVRVNNRFHTVADPLRQPGKLFSTAAAPIGTFKDKVLLVRLAAKVISGSLEEVFSEPETDTLTYLRQLGFSEKMIHSFFVPFFGGTCLDPDIQASSRVFLSILKMFASGDAALPLRGMEQIPLQIARRVPDEQVRTGSRAVKVEPGLIRLEDDRTITAKAIVIAAEEPETCRLLGPDRDKHESVGETCLYFGCDKAPWHSPYLVLNGDGSGPINNLAIPSAVSPAYAPPGKSLISVVVLGRQQQDRDRLIETVRTQLSDWYGNEVNSWQHLASYVIHHALPAQQPPSSVPYAVEPMVEDGLFVCGEYGSLPAIQWALLSGKKTAKAVMNYLT